MTSQPPVPARIRLLVPHIWWLFLVLGLLATAAYAALPSAPAQNWYFLAVIFVASSVILLGIRLHRPVDRWPWYLLLLGEWLWVAGDAVWTAYDELLHAEAPVLSLADPIYLCGYAVYAAGLVLVHRQRTPGGDHDSLIDATIISVGVGVLAWVYLIAPYAYDPALTVAERFMSIVYPVMDVLVLAIVVRLALAPGARSPALRWIVVGAGCSFVTDAGYGWMLLNGAYEVGSWPAYGWMLAYICDGVAALHPSMRVLAAPTLLPHPKLTRRRLVLLAGASLLAPTVLAVQSWRNEPVDVPVIVGGTVVLFVLSLLRMNTLVQALHAALVRLEVVIEKQKRAETQLAHQAFHDALTDLPNRALFVDRLEQALLRTTHHPAQVAVLFLDLDGFKVINDSLGHDAGDALLVAVAERLQRCVRPQDTVARLGGDEFTILLEELNDIARAEHVAERITTELRAPFTIGGRSVCVTTSVGIACGAAGNDVAEDLLRAADVAMYRAKGNGKACFTVFDAALDGPAFNRLDRETELRRAIEHGEFTLVYQPSVALTTAHVVGVEALLRWQHGARGVVPPSEFIPLAEETGLILPLGRWVLYEACRQAQVWVDERPTAPIVVSVNLSPRQFRSPDLVNDVAHVLRTTGLSPSLLALEITEGMLMDRVDVAQATLEALRKLGVQLWIDDFGTGYSSLSYLKRFPVHTLKIDRSFVDGLGRNPQDAAIVQAVITLAHSLGLQVTAEGIETAAQLHQLQALGCPTGQGYYFARPLPASAIAPLLGEAVLHAQHNQTIEQHSGRVGAPLPV